MPFLEPGHQSARGSLGREKGPSSNLGRAGKTAWVLWAAGWGKNRKKLQGLAGEKMEDISAAFRAAGREVCALLASLLLFFLARRETPKGRLTLPHKAEPRGTERRGSEGPARPFSPTSGEIPSRPQPPLLPKAACSRGSARTPSLPFRSTYLSSSG